MTSGVRSDEVGRSASRPSSSWSTSAFSASTRHTARRAGTTLSGSYVALRTSARPHDSGTYPVRLRVEGPARSAPWRALRVAARTAATTGTTSSYATTSSGVEAVVGRRRTASRGGSGARPAGGQERPTLPPPAAVGRSLARAVDQRRGRRRPRRSPRGCACTLPTRPVSALGSLGRPSTISPRMLRCTWLVPA